MTLTINRKPSKSGKRNVFFPTIEGKRLSRTNFTAKWEAVQFGRHCLAILKEKNIKL
ncbi:hypothetical protein [uncultured Mediterranean phage uvMED]|nr:hypothetical protein [uncultured Mediterranean phage uvMED]